MPSNWLYIDTNFPAFTGEESMEEKVTSIQDYMYLLVEQLRYTLHNLDLGNMNKTAKERWESAITAPTEAMPQAIALPIPPAAPVRTTTRSCSPNILFRLSSIILYPPFYYTEQ